MGKNTFEEVINMEKKKMIHTLAICSCFGLIATGAGLAFRNSEEKEPPIQTQLQAQNQSSEFIEIERVNISKTPTISDTNSSSNSNAYVSEDILETAVAPEPDVEENLSVTEEETALVFSYPTTGEILLPYSVESAIYDPTLDQYRTNNSMSFASREGDPVIASEKGTVAKISKDEERGNSVVVEHKDGWTTTYSQLASEMLVAVGDNVQKGQVLAVVAQPTKYTVALGEHLQFAIEKDGESQNPQTVVEDN